MLDTSNKNNHKQE